MIDGQDAWMEPDELEEALKGAEEHVIDTRSDSCGLQEAEGFLQSIDSGRPDLPTVMISGTHRFWATAEACRCMSDRFRFSTKGGDVVWSLYPYRDAQHGLRHIMKHGGKMVQTLRGSFWHSANPDMALGCCREADVVVPCSQNLTDSIAALYPELASKLVTVRQGTVPKDLSETEPWAFQGLERPVHLTISDYSYLMKSAGTIELEELFWRGKHGTLVLCGAGRHEKDQPVGPNVLQLGHVTDIYGALLGADTFVYNSMMDGVPNGLREAMRTGLPCAVRRHPWSGASEIIRDGETGLLFDSIYELDALLDRLPHEKDMGIMGAGYVTSELTWQAYADRMGDIFEGLL
jgi:hypothetical protein